MTLDLAEPAEPAVWAQVLAGATLTVSTQGQPQAVWTWQLGYAKDVLAEGRIQLDADGHAVLKLILPQVRHRVQLSLVLRNGEAAVTRPIVVFPAAMLADALQTVNQYRLGVIDPSLKVQSALTAEGVRHENLDTQTAADLFTGDVVILVGVGDPQALTEICRRLDQRVRNGMIILLLNPPAGWRGWDMECVQPPKPVESAVRLTTTMPHVLPIDLGQGPWKAVLKGRAGDVILAQAGAGQPSSASRPAPATASAATQPAVGVLALARRADRGRVVAAALPQLGEPDTGTVGRAILDDLILWILMDRENAKPEAAAGRGARRGSSTTEPPTELVPQARREQP